LNGRAGSSKSQKEKQFFHISLFGSAEYGNLS